MTANTIIFVIFTVLSLGLAYALGTLDETTSDEVQQVLEKDATDTP